MDLKLNQRKED